MGEPTKRYKAGSCIATIFTNERQDGASFHTVSLQRVYRDRAGQFQYTTTLKPGDIPKAIVVLARVYDHLLVEDKTAGGER